MAEDWKLALPLYPELVTDFGTTRTS